MFTPLEASKI